MFNRVYLRAHVDGLQVNLDPSPCLWSRFPKAPTRPFGPELREGKVSSASLTDEPRASKFYLVGY